MITFQSLADHSLTETSALMNRAYEGYAIPVSFSPDNLALRMTSDHVDLLESFVVRVDDAPAGVALIARRGPASRLAAFGIFREHRGAGLGRAAVAHMLDQARARNDAGMQLEVLAGNAAAIALYEAFGFRRVRALLSHENATGRLGAGAVALVQIDPAQAVALLHGFSDDGLPWQIAPAAFAATPSFLTALADDDRSSVALLDATAPDVRLLSFAVDPQRRGRGLGRRLISVLEHRFAGRRLFTAPLIPEGPATNLLQRAGWGLRPLQQYEMRCDLA